MIILDSTSDIIRIVTTSTATLEVHVSWVDWDGATSTPGSDDVAIASIATTTIVPAPGASVYRNVKTLTVCNTDASNPNTVTIEHFDGTDTGRLHPKVTLAAGESLAYNG